MEALTTISGVNPHLISRMSPPIDSTICFSAPLGINVRDILRLGALESFLDIAPNTEVILLSPAHRVPEFLQEFDFPRVKILPFRRFQVSSRIARLVNVRRRIRSRPVIDLCLRAESLWSVGTSELHNILHHARPELVISVHPQDWWDWELISYAHHLGIPTLGVVKSWDNIQRGLTIHPDFLAVWNNVNRNEAIELEKYLPERVRIIGAPPFDRYFTAGVIQNRETFMRSIGLDPAKPMVLYAPAGQVMDYGDETYIFEELLRIRDRSAALRSIQVVGRMHPNSRLEYFWRYREIPGVAFSFGSYIKTLGWSMTRDEVDHMANLLFHADIVITPGSTVALEAAVFDRPTILPAFHEAQPEHIKRWLVGWHFAKHYRPLVDNGWVPVAWSSMEMEEMMVRALQDPSWNRSGREAIVDHYVPFRDGRTRYRLAQLIAELVDHGKAVRRGLRHRREFRIG